MRVGRSVVSAITHTPASGPFGPVTTPPMSVAPTLTAAGVWAFAGACAPRANVRATAATPQYRLSLIVMSTSTLGLCCADGPAKRNNNALPQRYGLISILRHPRRQSRSNAMAAATAQINDITDRDGHPRQPPSPSYSWRRWL